MYAYLSNLNRVLLKGDVPVLQHSSVAKLQMGRQEDLSANVSFLTKRIDRLFLIPLTIYALERDRQGFGTHYVITQLHRKSTLGSSTFQKSSFTEYKHKKIKCLPRAELQMETFARRGSRYSGAANADKEAGIVRIRWKQALSLSIPGQSRSSG